MHGAGRDAVDLHRRVGHDALEHEEDPPSLPVGRDIETVAEVGMDRGVGFVLKAVTKFSKALQLPARRHGDVGPHAAVAPVVANEIPLHGVFAVVPRKVLADGDRPCRVSDAGDPAHEAQDDSE